MRSQVPTLHCDSEDVCDEWAVDNYETCASTVGGVRITTTTRAPGWVSTEDNDFCPEHAGEASHD